MLKSPMTTLRFLDVLKIFDGDSEREDLFSCML